MAAHSVRDFFHKHDDEIHAVRRMEILKKHPEIKGLMTHEWRTKYIVAATVILQVLSARLVVNCGWAFFFAYAYVVGATANHSLFLAIHELAHNLGAKKREHNLLISFLANFPIGIPYAVAFKPYHLEHHKYHAVEVRDGDLPSRLECFCVTDTALNRVDHTVRKAIFMFCQIFAYALRPCIVNPALMPRNGWLWLNWLLQFAFDGVMFAWLGPCAVLYLVVCTFFAGSIHPMAGHFLAEHYTKTGEHETFSYYGPLNRLAYNVGYHNEHHDFPNIPWSKLPMVRRLAPEFYDTLPQVHSWPGMIFSFIFDDAMSPYSRVKRVPKKSE